MNKIDIVWPRILPGSPGSPSSPGSPGEPSLPGPPGRPSFPESPRGPVSPTIKLCHYYLCIILATAMLHTHNNLYEEW